ncbi:MAG: ATP-dependent RecD-like DNA helicase [Candidatus Limivicinus sp.]|jgi:exodeoxyribonuclease V alpha subunit
MDEEYELLELSGTVDSIIYKNEENGYTVLRIRDGNDEQVTVVGCFPYAAPGESMIISGEWVNHSQHGRQFKAEFAQRLMPSGVSAIHAYLAGGAVKGIGPATATLLVDKFGDKTLDILESSPEELVTVRGISMNRAKQMSADFRRQTGVRRVMEFVCSFGLRPILAMRLYRYYGDESLEILRENPYIICTSHIGGNFDEADKLALEMGIDSTDSNRIRAAVLQELRHNTGNGHCFIPREMLAKATEQLIHIETCDADEGISRLIESGEIIYEEIGGVAACYLPELYYAETDTAERMVKMCSRKYSDDFDIDRLIGELEAQENIRYAPMQKDALRLALENQIVVITGGPGTGKTTSIKAILAMFNRLGLTTFLTAPTGRAAKRMSELSGQDAVTVHRLLEAKFSEDGETVVFTKNEEEKLNCDAVIIDECSMVDICLINALLRAMRDDARLIMVGDADQLPSVGPGNVFSAAIRSEVVPTVKLTEIFRQNEGSKIVRNAHLINKGEHPNLSENTGDFFRLKRLEAGTSIETIAELCAVRLPRRMNIPSDEIQVLAPTRKGDLGTVILNKELQNALNPPSKDKKEKLFGDFVFREGDRVMQVKNNYDMLWHNADNTVSGSGIYNGDIGKILSIDMEAENITVDFDGRFATYSFDSLLELEHAWALTVHKAQGNEYRAVILALSKGSKMLMTRDVLYTAITRAKELLIMVGDDAIAHQMIDNSRNSRRFSFFRVRLRKFAGV